MWLGRTMARPYRWRKVATGGRFRQVAVQGDEVSHPHTAGTSGTTCVVLTKIVPLRGTDSLQSLWLGRTMARPYRVERGCYGSANIGRFEMREGI